MTQDATDATSGADPASFAEGHLVRVKRLERQLAASRRGSVKVTRQLHARMLQDVREAEKRAAVAERRLARAQKRAKRAEAEIVALRESATWKAGRAVVAVPARIKRLRRR